MSKRFGRNQKRKLRNRIKELEEALERDDSLIKYMRGRIDQLEYEFNKLVTCIEQIAPNSVCLPPKKIEAHVNCDRMYMPLYSPISFDMTNSAVPVPLEVSRVKLSKFCVDIEKYRERFETLIHVYTEDRYCDIKYMISDNVLNTVGLPTTYVAQEIANYWRKEHMDAQKLQKV
ncbi:MAG: hypothetical protein DRO67_00580 [Candidatus Asgardarchaeum californiense]|nr:MAG: hypothetical protein DRO67_00580 [Candidatus Asgardarchaeum californiense]